MWATISENATHLKNPKNLLMAHYTLTAEQLEYARSGQASIKCEYQVIDADRRFNLAVIHHLLCRLNTTLSVPVNRKWLFESHTAHYHHCEGNH